MRSPTIPDPIAWLAREVHAAGGRAYLVGGGVRDHLLGREVKDLDIEVFGLDPGDLRAVLERRGRVNAVGRAFGVLKWRTKGIADEVDVSVPRRDSKVGPGHRGIAVEGDPTMSVDEATRRRDLTINALMWDLVDDALVDPQRGADDLAAGVLRAVDDDTFLEDPLRALRAVQFAARFGFSVHPTLVALCRRAALDELPTERVLGEWSKLLLRGVAFAPAFALARDAGLSARLFPEVEALPAPEAALQALLPRRSATEPDGRRLCLMLAGWLGPASPDAVTATLDHLGLHTWLGYRVRDALLAVHAAQGADANDDRDLRWLSTRAEVGLVLAVRGDDRGLARAAELGLVDRPPARLLLGRHLAALGMRGGPAMGDVLDEAWSAQLDGVLTTEDEALAWARDRVRA